MSFTMIGVMVPSEYPCVSCLCGRGCDRRCNWLSISISVYMSTCPLNKSSLQIMAYIYLTEAPTFVFKIAVVWKDVLNCLVIEYGVKPHSVQIFCFILYGAFPGQTFDKAIYLLLYSVLPLLVQELFKLSPRVSCTLFGMSIMVLQFNIIIHENIIQVSLTPSHGNFIEIPVCNLELECHIDHLI